MCHTHTEQHSTNVHRMSFKLSIDEGFHIYILVAYHWSSTAHCPQAVRQCATRVPVPTAPKR